MENHCHCRRELDLCLWSCHKTAEYGMGQERWRASQKRTCDKVHLEGNGHNLFRLPRGRLYPSVSANTEEGGWFRVPHLRTETVDEGPHPEEAAGPCSDMEAPSQQRSTSHFTTSDQISHAQADPGCTAPPYRPDLAPNVFYLYPMAKKDLKGKHFPSADAAVKGLEAILKRLSKPGFELVFLDWQRRWKKCIALNGDYFERDHSVFTRLRSRRVVMCLVMVYIHSFVPSFVPSFPHRITSI